MSTKLDPATQAAMEGKRALLLVSQHVHVHDVLRDAFTSQDFVRINRTDAEVFYPSGGSLLVRTFEQAWRGTLQGLTFDVIHPSGVMDDRLRPIGPRPATPLRYVDGRSVFARRRRKGGAQ